MFDPYRMVFVNVIALGLVILFLGLYKYVLGKSIKPIFVVVIFSLLPIISIFRKGVYESGDFNLQIYRAIDFYNSLSFGIILPRWGSILNAHFGHPIFIFAAPLPYYVISFFHLAGFSFVASTKLLLIFAFIGSGLTMYYFVKKYYGDRAGVVASIFYLYAPFHLVDLHFRVSLGDVLAFMFYPLAFLFSDKLLNKYRAIDFILFSLTVMLLIISHPITIPALIFLAIYCLFTVYSKGKSIRNLVILLVSFIVGLLLSSFYWLPLISEAKFTYDGVTSKVIAFTNVPQLLYSPWRWGLLFQGPEGELSPLVGYSALAVITIAVLMLLKPGNKIRHSKKLSFLIISFFAFVFLISPYSSPIWEEIKIINSIQFTYRLLFILVFICSLIAGITLTNVKRNWIIVLVCFFTILTTILNWGNRRVIPQIDDKYLKRNVSYSTYQGEGASPSMPIWRNPKNPWEKVVPADKLVATNGRVEIKEIYNSPIKYVYLVNVGSDTELKANLLYFPGWSVKDNGKKLAINYQKEGLIEFGIGPGLHKIEIIFEKTSDRKLAKKLTFLGFLVIFLVISSNFYSKSKKSV